MKTVVSTVAASPAESNVQKPQGKKTPSILFIALSVVVSLAALGAGYFWGNSVGYDDGYTTGNDDGYSIGYSAGYSAGYAPGMEKGYDTGASDAYRACTSEEYNRGYDAGFSEGRSDALSGYRSDSPPRIVKISELISDPYSLGHSNGRWDGYHGTHR